MNNKNQDQFISKENKKRILLCVNALLMVVLIVVATYAWFSRTTVDDIKVNEIAFQGSSDLEVSLNDTDYAFSQDLKFNSSSLAQDITGNGLPSSFVRPSLTSSTDNSTLSVPNTADTSAWKTSLSGDDNEGQTQSSDYKIKTIYFRSKKAMTVYLGDGSQVLGAAEVNNKNLVGPSNKDVVGNKSTVKDVKDASNDDVSVSKDCIVGATRFAFLDAGETAVKCLWIPRPNIFYETKISEDKEVKTIYGGTSSTLANLVDSKDTTQAYRSPTTHYYYDATIDTIDNETKVVTNASLATATNAIAGSTDLSTTSRGNSKSKLVTLEKESTTEYYKGSIKVVIWVEGCDAEARQAFAGGKFGATLRFVGIEK